MKKLAIASIAMVTLLFTSPAKAETLDMSGGVKNNYQYEEVVFISGQPVLFKGEGKAISIKESNKGGKAKRDISLTLTGPSNRDKLTRKISYESDVISYDNIGQKTAEEKITKYTETIDIGQDKYSLIDYEYSDAQFVDVRPASDYYSGKGITRKVFDRKVNRNAPQERINVNVETRRAGYENFWGATEALISDYNYERELDGIVDEEWTVTNKVNVTKSSIIELQQNLASGVSYDEYYVIERYKEMGSIYEYELPDGTMDEISLEKAYTPTNSALPVAKFNDIQNLDDEAYEAIKKMYGLQVINDYPSTILGIRSFKPGVYITRVDFTSALAKLIDLRVDMPDEKSKTKAKGKNNTSYFKDLPATNENYEAILLAVQKGLTTGNGRCDFTQPPIVEKAPSKNKPGITNPCSFSPNNALTREHAASFMIRALGLQNNQANMQAVHLYLDDDAIGESHRNNVYLAQELGLMHGTEDRFEPRKNLTRAQAMRMLDRLLTHLEDDLKSRYVNDVIFSQ
ncbi:MAG TPA: S-layer homology domain-containing protein [Metalysinibacillus jejuensis]|uniref:S-layer homology domain-containing protein n=1 Tax=Metalysinibacillus jejuensis TaxID=914327 RepID=A0A921T5C9_9BACL|nr:S-layer homology domain-containing protein [Metalysinibacillus jejuensis]